MARQLYVAIPELVDWISDMKRRAALARATKRSPDYLYQVATGRRRAHPDVADTIDSHTKGVVKRERVIWPKKRRAASARRREQSHHGNEFANGAARVEPKESVNQR